MATTTKKSVTSSSTTTKSSSSSATGSFHATPASKLSASGSSQSGSGSASEVSSGESRRDRRSTSPNLLSRLQEKTELATLNDRLATYIEVVRKLESENSRLSRIVESQETTVRTEVTGIKGLYEDELAAARKLLDEVSGDKAKLLVEIGRLKSELGDLKEKLRLKDSEAADAIGRLHTSETKLKDLEPKLRDAETQRSRLEAEIEKLKKERDALASNLASTKKKLEEETVARVDSENRCQSLREECDFLKQVHEQELNESITRTRVVVNEVDDRLKVEYDNQLRDALLQMREEMDEQLQTMREETETVLQKRLKELGNIRDVGDGPFAELRSTRAELDELKSRLVQLNSENSAYEARIRSLENQLQRTQDAHQSELDSLNAELRRVRGLLDEQLLEFKDLMDVKVRLDAEISAYRKMLESEEMRLDELQERTSPGKKRKLQEKDESFSTSHHASTSVSRSNAVTVSEAKDAVTVEESSADGLFVKLLNTSADKDVTLTGWQLRQTCNNNETTYKFPRSYELKAQKRVTVWSSKSGHAAAPPADLVMRSQNWVIGDEVLTELLDQKGEKMAFLETKWSGQSPSRSVLTDSAKKVEQQKSSSIWRSPWSLFSFSK